VTAPSVWFVVPEGFDDPQRVSGGNVYDQRVRDELQALGYDVRVVEARPAADPFERIPDGELVLVDGLVAISAPEAVELAADRLRVVAIVHMLAEAFGHPDSRWVDGERRALPRARHVIATSAWLRDEILARGLAAPERITVATPGVDAAAPAVGSPAGGSLLCVGVVAPHKGQDTLVDALARLGADRAWTCTFAGSAAAEPGFGRQLSAAAARAGLSQRIRWAGVLDARELDDAYGRADVLVAPSRTESYGIAVGEALARGIPVIASRVGGVLEAAQPSDAVMLVPPGDPNALGDALQRWLDHPALREEMAAAARRAAAERGTWGDTARVVHATLAGLS
jgi:glycosyltransferase involved in cell wall biosynthesis